MTILRPWRERNTVRSPVSRSTRPRERGKRKDRRLQQAARQGGRKLAFGLKGKLLGDDERNGFAARAKLGHPLPDKAALSAACAPGEERDRGRHQKRSRCSGL